MIRLWLLFGLLLSQGACFAQAGPFTERQRFIEELSSMLLGTEGSPLQLEPGRGWRGVVLAPPGTASASLMTPFEVFGNDTVSASRLLESLSTFDRPLSVANGIATPGPAPLSQVWELVLERTRPPFLAPPISLEGDPDLAILFRQTDDVDKARGVVYRREPSEAMLRYREYELTIRSLSAEENRESGFWRMNPRLSQYSTLQDAKAALIEDWITYGFKREIESARQSFVAKSSLKSWTDWTVAQSAFSAARIFIGPENWVPQTILFPPPSEWLGMGTWLRGVSLTSDPNIRVVFQVARVRIIRPWFQLESLLDGRLRLRKSAKEQQVVLSDGQKPTILSAPAGLMAVVPEELVLVRGTRFIVKDSVPEQRVSPRLDHPLGLFAYPEEVNLLGYTVRSIPRILN